MTTTESLCTLTVKHKKRSKYIEFNYLIVFIYYFIRINSTHPGFTFINITVEDDAETLHTVSNVKINIFQIKIFEEISHLLIIILSFFVCVTEALKSCHSLFDHKNVLQLAH